jgi:hypothetical protein
MPEEALYDEGAMRLYEFGRILFHPRIGRGPPQRRHDHHDDGHLPRGELIAALPARAWCGLSAGAGAHAPREYWWARVPVRIGWQPGRGHWLLARRSITTGEIAY